MNERVIAANKLSSFSSIAKRILRGVSGACLVPLALCAFSANARGQSVTAPWGDDFNTSTLNPLAAVSTLANAQSASISTALTNYGNANNANPPPSGEHWTYNWAGAAQEASVEKGINVVTYKPFAAGIGVVNLPPAGTTFDAVPKGENAGALITLTYTPNNNNNAPVLQNAFWIQAYSGTIYGNNFGPILDNNPTGPYQSQSNSLTPYYGGAQGAIVAGGNNSYFADEPTVPELNVLGPKPFAEYENNPIVSANFAVVLATDSYNAMTNTNTLTLYGGYTWGFTYTAMDRPVPEPSSLVLGSLGVVGIVIHALRRRRSVPAVS